MARSEARTARAEAKAAKAKAKALRPWYRKKRFFLLGLVVVIVIIVIAVSAGGGKSSPPSAAGSAATTASTTGAVLFSQAGSGTASTANFTTPTNWNVDWTYNCSAYGYKANFIVTISQAGTGSMASLGDIPINQLGMSGSGVQHYHYGGKLYLAVDSECKWTVKAVSA